jgi:hypothetical protein
MDARPCGFEPGDHVAVIGYLHSLTPCSYLAVNLLIFCGMRSNNSIVARKRLLKSRDELSEFLKDSLFEVPERYQF